MSFPYNGRAFSICGYFTSFNLVYENQSPFGLEFGSELSYQPFADRRESDPLDSFDHVFFVLSLMRWQPSRAKCSGPEAAAPSCWAQRLGEGFQWYWIWRKSEKEDRKTC